MPDYLYVPGEISISRTVSNKEGRYITIDLSDPKSHKTVARIKISPKELGEAITGLGDQKCNYVLIR